MADKFDRDNIQNRFRDGEKPDGADFKAWIDSSINQKSDRVFANQGRLGIGVENPQFPLEVRSDGFGEGISFKIQNDRQNASLAIGSPAHQQVTLGVGEGQSLSMGHYNEVTKGFTAALSVNRNEEVSIGSSENSGKLQVNGSLEVKEKIVIGGLVLGVENGQLVVWVDKKPYPLSYGDNNSSSSSGSKYLLIVMIITAIFLMVALIASIFWGPFF